MLPRKSLFARVGNLFHGSLKEKIFFLHLPKCGGTSVGHAIRCRYLTLDISKDRYLVSLGAEASSNVVGMIDQTNYPYDTSNDYAILKLRENLLLYFMSEKSTRYISGHFAFSETAYREFRGKYAFITVLRDPVKRWMSSYFFNRYKTSEHRSIEEDIITHLESPFGRSQGYEYVKFLGGPDEAGDYTSMAAVNRAKSNLDKFNIVGFLEHQDHFLKQFEDQFGIRLKLETRNQNPTSRSYRKCIVTEEIEEQIKAICEPDRKLYQYAVKNFLKPNY